MTYEHQTYQISQDGFQNEAVIPRRQPRRWWVFLGVFLPTLIATQSLIFLQPAIYQSVATVLTMAPTDIDQTSPDADLQHVSIQKQVLLGPAILEKTAERLNRSPSDPTKWSVDGLKTLFSVSPLADTNLLQLRAEGPQPAALQSAVNVWIDSYLQARAAYVAEHTDKVTAEINGELQRIERQVGDKRHEIEQFRLQHSIVSLDSADNQAHARLQGLNKSLNEAMETEVKASAKLAAIRDAVSRGKNVVPEADGQLLAVLVRQAEKLREQLAELQANYTQEYIQLNPNLRRVQEQLGEIESKIAEKVSVGRHYAEQEAENNLAAAKQAVIAIEKQMAAHKQAAADYTSQFAEHQALQQELLRLETLQQDTQQRLVSIDVKQRQKYPQVDVVDWASLPDQPIRPAYLQQAALALAGCLLLGLLAVFVVDYLGREADKVMVQPPMASIHLHQQPRQFLNATLSDQRLAHQPLPALAQQDNAVEITEQDLRQLFRSAEGPSKILIALLLNGLTVAEIISLSNEHVDLAARQINIPGLRTTAMTTYTFTVFSQLPLSLNWPTAEDVDALLCCAAIDAGLSDPEQVNATSLRYSYLLFLVRQGIKLSDLAKIVGPLPPARLVELSRFSPAQAGLALSEIDLDYPGLA